MNSILYIILKSHLFLVSVLFIPSTWSQS